MGRLGLEILGLGRLSAALQSLVRQSRVPDHLPSSCLEHSQPGSSRSILGHLIRPFYSSSA